MRDIPQYYTFRSMDYRAGHRDGQGSTCHSGHTRLPVKLQGEASHAPRRRSGANHGVTAAVPTTYIASRIPFFRAPPSSLQYLDFKYWYSLSIIMRAAIFLSAFLCALSAAASSAIDAFKRVDRVIEPRKAAQHIAPAHSHERLQKRASPYLNNVTQS